MNLLFLFSMTINTLYTSKTKKNENIQDEPSNNKEEPPNTTLASWWTNPSNKTRREPVLYNFQALDNQSKTTKYKSYYPIRKKTEGPSVSKIKKATLKQTAASHLKTRGNSVAISRNYLMIITM